MPQRFSECRTAASHAEADAADVRNACAHGRVDRLGVLPDIVQPPGCDALAGVKPVTPPTSARDEGGKRKEKEDEKERHQAEARLDAATTALHDARGNAEAARRAGINGARIRILCFMISGSMAAMGGVIFASYLSSVDLTAGGSTILLDSISAAVIGGVSLFGGRGRVSGALYGGLIIGMIANGIDAVGYTDAIKYITTGVILLAAVTLDTVARRRQVAAGR